MKNFWALLAAAVVAGTVLAIAAPETIINPHGQFVNANHLLEKGDAEHALDIFQALTRQGFEGTALYYNLGNLYYRKGERGKAILWYERALRLSPRDGDIQFNLSLARSHIRDEGENLVEKFFTYFTPTELGVVTMALCWIFFGFLGSAALGWISGDTWPRVVLSLSGILLLVAGSWFAGDTWMSRQPEAVVVSPPGEVRNGPGLDYAVGFTVPEGSRVTIMNRRPEWTQVGVPQQGLKGWMPSGDVEAINFGSAPFN